MKSLKALWSSSKRQIAIGFIRLLVMFSTAIVAFTGPLLFFLPKVFQLGGNLKLTFLESFLLSALTLVFFSSWLPITRLKIGGASSSAIAYWSSSVETAVVMLIYLLLMSDVVALNTDNYFMIPQLIREWFSNVVSWISLILVPLGLVASIDSIMELSFRLKDLSVNIARSYLYKGPSRVMLSLILASLHIFSFFSTGFWIVSSNLGLLNLIGVFFVFCGVPAYLQYRSTIRKISNLIKEKVVYVRESGKKDIGSFRDRMRLLSKDIPFHEEELKKALEVGDIPDYNVLTRKYKNLYFAIPFFILFLSFGISFAMNLLVIPNEAIVTLAKRAVYNEIDIFYIRICASFLLASATTGILSVSLLTLKREFQLLLDDMSKTIEDDAILLAAKRYLTMLN